MSMCWAWWCDPTSLAGVTWEDLVSVALGCVWDVSCMWIFPRLVRSVVGLFAIVALVRYRSDKTWASTSTCADWVGESCRSLQLHTTSLEVRSSFLICSSSRTVKESSFVVELTSYTTIDSIASVRWLAVVVFSLGRTSLYEYTLCARIGSFVQTFHLLASMSAVRVVGLSLSEIALIWSWL
jgi:hypothetical protein